MMVWLWMDKEKLETIIIQLKWHRHNVDNILYEHYSVEGLKKDLEEIQESIDYLESFSKGIVQEN